MLNTATKPVTLHRADDLSDYKLHGTDGNIGTIKEFYFDDQHWTIRYIVANTGNWLTGREVLISPYSLGTVNNEEEFITVNLTKKQIEDSPTFEMGQSISQQFEKAHNNYYGLPSYWNGPNMWGAEPNLTRDNNIRRESESDIAGGTNMGRGVDTNIVGGTNMGRGVDTNIVGGTNMGRGAESNVAGGTNVGRESVPGQKEMWDHQLHNTSDVNGYDIVASDGEIGDVKDFIIEDGTWAIRYLVVDTGSWLPGKKVMIATQWIDHVSWEDSKVFVNLSRDAIDQSPEFTDESLLSRDYETGLYKHYNRPGYWSE